MIMIECIYVYLCAHFPPLPSGVLLFFELIHASNELHYLILVLLASAHALLFQNGLSFNNGLLQVLQFFHLSRAKSSRFLLGLLFAVLPAILPQLTFDLPFIPKMHQPIVEKESK